MFLLGLVISFLYVIATSFSGIAFFNGRRVLARLGAITVFAAAPLHLVYLVAIGVRDRTVPLASFYQALSVISLFLVLIYIVLRVASVPKSIEFFVFPFIFALHAIATFGPRVMYLGENFIRSPLFWFHTMSTLLGYAAFGYSMILGIMYLHLFRELKRNRPSRMYDRLPPLELLDRLNKSAMVGGFVFLTVGMILGGALAMSVWNYIPFLDAKILVSLALWLVYVFGITMHLIRQWSGRKMSLVSIGGFAVVVAGVVIARLFESSFHRF